MASVTTASSIRTSASTLKAIRLTHHYIGVFLAPTILFFAFTGGLQVFSLHETTHGSSYVPPAILVHLAQVHKKSTWAVPQRKPQPERSAAAPEHTPDHAPDHTPDHAPTPASSAPKSAAPQPQAPQPFHWPAKIFFGITALGLILSTLTGLVMSWQYTRNKPLIAGLILAGIFLPILLLQF